MPLLLLAALSGPSQTLKDLQPLQPQSSPPTLVLGFLGGWERWDDSNRSARKLAHQLRAEAGPGVYIETFSNHRRNVAFQLICQALDTNRNGAVDPAEAASARIILYGQSLGGRAVVKLARRLESLHIPVLLTVQVDSVGLNDSLIPPNVRNAANLYQRDLFSIWGEDRIRAADPARTRILENVQYQYSHAASQDKPETWARRRLGGGHARMEADPAVWSHVHQLIENSLKGLN